MGYKAFRFGVQSFSASSAKEWTERARRAEALGYSTLHLADHILGPGAALERTNHPLQELAAVPAMAVAAAVTTTLRVGCRVFCVDYRNPVVLAKEAMTLDLLSDGRLELGLGAGWLQGEYQAIGLDFEPAGRRISRLGDVVAAVKQFATGEPLDVANDTVRWQEFAGRPMPVQSPHPPIMIGGGAPRILRLAGREADIVSLNFNNRSGMIGPDGVMSSTADATRRKVDWIRDGAGERFESIEIEIGAYFTVVSDQAQPIVKQFADMFGLSEEQMREHPHALFGSPEAICEELVRRRELFGISYVTVPDNAMEGFAPVVARLAGK